MLKTCLFVSYTCSLFRDGYMLKGNNTTQCFFGNWTGMTPWCKEGNFFWINQSKRWGGRHIMPLLLLFRKCWKTKQVRKRTAAKECAVANPFSCLICGKEAKRVLRSFDNSCPKLRTLVLWISKLIIDHDLLLINRLLFFLDIRHSDPGVEGTGREDAPELGTLVLDTLNLVNLLSIFTGDTFDFLLNHLFWISLLGSVQWEFSDWLDTFLDIK